MPKGASLLTPLIVKKKIRLILTNLTPFIHNESLPHALFKVKTFVYIDYGHKQRKFTSYTHFYQTIINLWYEPLISLSFTTCFVSYLFGIYFIMNKFTEADYSEPDTSAAHGRCQFDTAFRSRQIAKAFRLSESSWLWPFLEKV
jgi:hypothetical protein